MRPPTSCFSLTLVGCHLLWLRRRGRQEALPYGTPAGTSRLAGHASVPHAVGEEIQFKPASCGSALHLYVYTRLTNMLHALWEQYAVTLLALLYTTSKPSAARLAMPDGHEGLKGWGLPVDYRCLLPAAYRQPYYKGD